MGKNSRTNTSNLPKIALFYDWLNQWGGAEKVLLDLIELFPGAPIYTLVYNPKTTAWLPENVKIIPSFINKFPFAYKNPIFYTPFYPLAVKQFDLSSYDIIISTTSSIGHFLSVPTPVPFVCYCHNINRYVYNTPKQFKFLTPLLKIYQKIDKTNFQHPNLILCNSQTVQNRIRKTYQRCAKIIYPGIDTKTFIPDNQKPKDYFLIVSRLVKHKRIDLAIKACHQLNLKLKIIGEGRDKKSLLNLKNKLRNNTIEFVGQIPQKKLINYYQNCQALICPQIEDYGLTPLEAQACGRPVIALNKGGITETVINNKTGIFFKHQTTKSLIKALKKFSKMQFNPKDCINQASKFSRNNFMLNFMKTIKNLWQS